MNNADLGACLKQLLGLVRLTKFSPVLVGLSRWSGNDDNETQQPRQLYGSTSCLSDLIFCVQQNSTGKLPE
jgi:hypothetical protein